MTEGNLANLMHQFPNHRLHQNRKRCQHKRHNCQHPKEITNPFFFRNLCHVFAEYPCRFHAYGDCQIPNAEHEGNHMRAGTNLLTYDKPTGDMHNSPIV